MHIELRTEYGMRCGKNMALTVRKKQKQCKQALEKSYRIWIIDSDTLVCGDRKWHSYGVLRRRSIIQSCDLCMRCPIKHIKNHKFEISVKSTIAYNSHRAYNHMPMPPPTYIYINIQAICCDFFSDESSN